MKVMLAYARRTCRTTGMRLLCVALLTLTALPAEAQSPQSTKLDLVAFSPVIFPSGKPPVQTVEVGTNLTILCRWAASPLGIAKVTVPTGVGTITRNAPQGEALQIVNGLIKPGNYKEGGPRPEGQFSAHWRPTDLDLGKQMFYCTVRFKNMEGWYEPGGGTQNNQSFSWITVIFLSTTTAPAPKPTVPRLSANEPSGPVQRQPMPGLGTALSGAVKSCQTSLSASVNVDSHQFASAMFGPADMAQTNIMLHLQKSEAVGNNINCHYSTQRKDVPNLVVTVKCNNAAPHGGQPHSYGCTQ